MHDRTKGLYHALGRVLCTQQINIDCQKMSELTFNEWKALLKSLESADRSYAADNPPEDSRREVVRLLIKCLSDPDELVRTCAADSLGMYPTTTVRKVLRIHIDREQDQLAKAYTVSSLGAVGTLDDIGRLAEVLSTDSDAQIQIHAALGLAFCSLCASVEHLLTCVKEDNRMRGTAANCLREYLYSHRAYVKLIRDTVEKQLKKKNIPEGKRESMINLLKEIEEYYRISD